MDTIFGLSREDFNQYRQTTAVRDQEIRFLVPMPCIISNDQIPYEEPLYGVVVDVETEGLLDDSQVISLGYVKFAFDNDLKKPPIPVASGIYYNDPKRPLTQEIVDLTGLTNADLEGREIDEKALRRVFGDCSIAAAHNAAFDRGRIDFLASTIRTKLNDLVWVDTANDVDHRRKYGNGSRSLASLLAQSFGYYMTHHEALDDAWGAFHVLRRDFEEMVVKAMKPNFNIFAWGSDINKKDSLKLRGYRWDGGNKVWWKKNVPEAERDEELSFSKSCGATPEAFEIHPFHRFTEVN